MPLSYSLFLGLFSETRKYSFLKVNFFMLSYCYLKSSLQSFLYSLKSYFLKRKEDEKYINILGFTIGGKEGSHLNVI